MAVRFQALLTLSLLAIATSGCSWLPFGRDEPRSLQPSPLVPAPTGSVTGETLPPPGAADLSQTPSGLAALDPSLQTGATSAATGNTQLGRTDLLGGWTLTAASDSCQLFMTLTSWAGGYRASTRGCTSADLQTISAWNMEGNQVQLYNDAGSTVARLYPASKTQFNGQTAGGGPVTVSR
jgi:hypothetical protein